MPPGGPLNSDSDLESVISLQVEKPKSRRNSVAERYICSIEGCKQTFRRLDHLDRHEYKHTGIKKHACHFEGCDKIYSILTHLKRHIRTTHERKVDVPNKTIPCEVDTCDKMFTSLTNMHRHIREVHENPKVYKCQFCEMKFSQKLKMRRHEISKHTGIYPHTCEKCSKGFYQKWQWEKHEESCKIYPCLTCHKKFEKWTLFQKHCKETQHTCKYYKCEYCESAYVKPSDLQKHVAAKHMAEGENQTQTGEYKCHYEGCDRSYAYERNLRQHITTSHEGKKFECTEVDCKREFSSLQNLQKHVQRDHVLMANKKKKESKTNKRKKRKDAGVPKISNLAKLTGISAGTELNKRLQNRDTEALAEVAQQLIEEQHVEDSCSEFDVSGDQRSDAKTSLVKETENFEEQTTSMEVGTEKNRASIKNSTENESMDQGPEMNGNIESDLNTADLNYVLQSSLDAALS
ncbi:transcription factor IIIA [Musca vetustissima]|uniref:transcription factor IIIA n=1 Tax=Musca vetustissima TaxID=27455 RepID=UPI002AB6E332|nr:transcription factor IIIA [Musca vetustissima]